MVQARELVDALRQFAMIVQVKGHFQGKQVPLGVVALQGVDEDIIVGRMADAFDGPCHVAGQEHRFQVGGR